MMKYIYETIEEHYCERCGRNQDNIEITFDGVKYCLYYNYGCYGSDSYETTSKLKMYYKICRYFVDIDKEEVRWIIFDVAMRFFNEEWDK